jgi:hypothetical protein
VVDAAAPPAPTHEIGAANLSGDWWTVDLETTPELMWPRSLAVYDAMVSQDAQVMSVLRAVTLPVLRTSWRINPAGARPEVARHVARDLGLPLLGEKETPLARTRGRFSWYKHLRYALLMMRYGHAYFEQVYRIDSDGWARLRKLAPRAPRTIARINEARDGGLISVEQYPVAGEFRNAVIPVDRLVAYVHDQESGGWLGRSLLRPGYKNWLLKDRLLRVQTTTIERNGMGIPVYEGAEHEQDLTEGRKIAAAYRAGTDSGAAIPNTARLRLLGVEGNLPDADKAIRYHDEQIARTVLAHFLNLGTQTGSWALGSSFMDFFVASLQTVAENLGDTAQAHVVEDIVDVNYGPDEPAPLLEFDEIGSRQSATAEAIKMLVDAGILFPDRKLEEFLRTAYGLPSKDTPPPTGGDS